MTRAAEEALAFACDDLHDAGMHKDAARVEALMAELRERRTRPLDQAEVRDAVLRLERFTVAEMCSEVGRTREPVTKALKALEKRGIIAREAQLKRHGGAGRPAVVYAYVPPPNGYVKREKRKPPEVEMAAKLAKLPQAPRPASGRRLRITNPDVRALAHAARTAGWAVEASGGGHIWLNPPAGSTEERILLPKSPSDHRAVLNSRALLRKAGIPV